MASIFTKDILVRAEHVDFTRCMRPSELLRIFQDCCITHTEELGMGRDKTLDKGFLWVLVSERFQINRLPRYDERIHIECYPGPMLHYFFPRHLIIADEKGNVLVKAASLWTLIDEENRDFIDPKENGIVIEGMMKPDEVNPMVRLSPQELKESFEILASASLCDINGHVNNANYLDLALDRWSKEDYEKRIIKEIEIAFAKEIRLGEKAVCLYENRESESLFHSDYFSLKIRY